LESPASLAAVVLTQTSPIPYAQDYRARLRLLCVVHTVF
jgi:hypothetical protein